MNNHTERPEANREPIAPERQKLGDPPTAEEMHAYFAGTLSEAEAERIQDLLVADPDLARAYSAPMPDAPRPGDPDYVSDEQVAERWQRLEAHLGRNVMVLPAKRWSAFQWIPSSVAAALAVVSLLLYQQVQRLQSQAVNEPVFTTEAQLLHSDFRRSGADRSTPLHASGNLFVLNLQPEGGIDARDYRIQIIRLENDGTERPVGPGYDVEPDAQGNVGVIIPRQLLPPGEYRIDLIGIDGMKETPISRFFVHTPAE
ncbi:MAG TPA: hypothetical protein VHW00_08830 [Thermoanaerobaculia bacterium]|nr:hypothetical protein [Thermoanaerobaculia bacterium]